MKISSSMHTKIQTKRQSHRNVLAVGVDVLSQLSAKRAWPSCSIRPQIKREMKNWPPFIVHRNISNFYTLRKSIYLPQQNTAWSKKLAPFLYALTSSNINRFSKFFHSLNHGKICNNSITKDPTTPQVCRYTTLCPIKAPRRGVLPSKPRPVF